MAASDDRMVHVFAYVKEKKTADATGRELVEKRLVSHVTILPGFMIFKFSDHEPVEDEETFIMMMRTRPSKCEEIAKIVAERDNFEPPELFSHTVEFVDPGFRDWVLERVTK